MLFDYFPLNIYGEDRSHISRLPIPITEIFVHIFLISIGIEEIRQVWNLSTFLKYCSICLGCFTC